MWNSTSHKVPCPCPTSKPTTTEDIPVIRIKVPELEEDLEKLNEVGNEYTDRSVAETAKEQEPSKAFVGPCEPVPYTLSLSGGPPHPGQHAYSPPLWVLIDHALAVIWRLFSSKKEYPIDVGQLQWALAFLLSLHDGNGHYTPDVQLCIEVIENRLFTHFVDANKKQRTCGLQICDTCQNGKLDKEGTKGKEPLTPIKEETSNVGIPSMTPFICPNAEVSDKPVPVSVTIHSMLKSHSPSVHQLYKAGSSTINKPSEETFSMSRPTNLMSELPLATSKDEVLEFLRQWREDQISRIEGETSRLRSIEALMANVDHSSSGNKGT